MHLCVCTRSLLVQKVAALAKSSKSKSVGVVLPEGCSDDAASSVAQVPTICKCSHVVTQAGSSNVGIAAPHQIHLRTVRQEMAEQRMIAASRLHEAPYMGDIDEHVPQRGDPRCSLCPPLCTPIRMQFLPPQASQLARWGRGRRGYRSNSRPYLFSPLCFSPLPFLVVL